MHFQLFQLERPKHLPWILMGSPGRFAAQGRGSRRGRETAWSRRRGPYRGEVPWCNDIFFVVILREACGSHVVHVTVKSPSIENDWGVKNMWELPSLAVLGWTIQISHSKEHGEGAVYAAKPPFFGLFFPLCPFWNRWLNYVLADLPDV